MGMLSVLRRLFRKNPGAQASAENADILAPHCKSICQLMVDIDNSRLAAHEASDVTGPVPSQWVKLSAEMRPYYHMATHKMIDTSTQAESATDQTFRAIARQLAGKFVFFLM